MGNANKTHQPIDRGLKAKTINKVLFKKISGWIATLPEDMAKIATENVIVSGGCIASMLLGERPNDYDCYFKTRAATLAMARHYVGGKGSVLIEEHDDRIRLIVRQGAEVDGAEDMPLGEEELVDEYDPADDVAADEVKAEGRALYELAYVTTNAISLSGGLQLVTRFFGEPDEIHANYDFAHCTNYYDYKTNTLVLRPKEIGRASCRERVYVLV